MTHSQTSSLAYGPLQGLKVLDLSRILAGPTCTQLLGDLGADVLKVERPGKGDDTRAWGPPFVRDADGRETTESAYYLCCNRNKRSVAVDLASEAGVALIKRLACEADVVVENFKAGDLARRGLDYDGLSAENPRLIYCSVTGFGQTGPRAPQAGYDFMIQGMGGIMSITGFPDEEGGHPTKVGVGIADVMTGMYAASAILAALHARERTGRGQYIDLALFDCQLAWLANQGLAYLTDGREPGRLGNGHPTIVPYETFEAADGHFIIAVGNDGQFAKLCAILGAPELASDPRFARNVDRVKNRRELVPHLNDLTRTRPAAEWLAECDVRKVPAGPVNTIPQAFADPQAVHREMRISLPHALAGRGAVDLIGNPIKFSDTKVSYRHAPPTAGQHTDQALTDWLDLSEAELQALQDAGAIARDQGR